MGNFSYLPPDKEQTPIICPFCQQKTISQEFIDNLNDYFNESYEGDLDKLNELILKYREIIDEIPEKVVFDINPFIQEVKDEFDNKYNTLKRILETNLKKLEEKVKAPSQIVTLNKSADAIENLNSLIKEINIKISQHNGKIDNKNSSLNDLKMSFWNLMRWEYDQTISNYQHEESSLKKDYKSISDEIKKLDESILEQQNIISKEQRNTVNIQQAVENINNGLVDLGIEDFWIKKHSENLYKIVRSSNETEIFHSLSEGEKMIISFLYFIELCRGKSNINKPNQKKVVVIDDPISSLSHIYIFNVGQLIKNEFLRSDKHEQIFILTHSLYFFYELTETNHEKRKENQNLYRLIKNTEGSKILTMSYEEIQNDYHSYWQIIKDDKQSPALIANCMRNIVEYFFNFIEKRDLNNVFQKPTLQQNKFEAFRRYISRESHSLGQNIFDIKEFNYADFKEGLKLLFEESGYKEHYDRMMK